MYSSRQEDRRAYHARHVKETSDYEVGEKYWHHRGAIEVRIRHDRRSML